MSNTGNPIGDALRETCILASVSCRAFGLTGTDKVASKQVTEANHAVQGAARVVVSRLPGVDQLHRAIINTQTTARTTLQKRSMRFGDEDGWRLLPNVQFEHIMPELGTIKSRFKAQIEELRQAAPEILAQAQINAGTLSTRVPTVDELVSSYSLDTTFKPIADPRSFGNLPPSTVAKLAKHVESRTRAAFEKAQADVLERMYVPLESFIERMEAFDKREALLTVAENTSDVSRAGVFRDTVVTNIRDIVDVLGSFNVTGDPRFTELGKMLEPFATIKPRDLRSDPALRVSTKERVGEALTVLSDWMTPLARAA